jgi:small redox-active disulfide protein 2
VKNVKVLGTGCANCKTTLRLVEETAREKGVSIELEKVEELQEIMRYGVMRTPAVVVDGQVVHSGGIPERAKIATWF